MGDAFSRDEFDEAVRAGEQSAASLAARFGVSERTVQRKRNKLRDAGVNVRISEDVGAAGGG